MKNRPCFGLPSEAGAYILSAKFLEAHIEAAKLLQAWAVSRRDASLLAPKLEAFNGAGDPWVFPSPIQGEADHHLHQERSSKLSFTFPADQYFYASNVVPSHASCCKEVSNQRHHHTDLINSLPDELLCHIFCFLPRARERSACASVSKRWLLLQSRLRQDEFMCSHAEDGLDEACDEVKSLEAISEGGGKADDDDKRIKKQSQWAKGDLSRCLEGRKATDVRVAAMAVGTGARGGLGKLSIRQGSATDVGLSAVGFCCAALRNLCLWDCPNFKDEGLSTIGKGCRLLEKVDLFKCPLVGDLGLQSIAKNCPLLSFLSLDECGLVSNKSLVAVGEGCSNLLSLNIRNCPLIGDDGLVSAVCNLKKLKRMKLEGLRVGDKSLACIGLYAKALVRLSLQNLDVVSEEGFILFSKAAGMQSLKLFSVTSCKNFTDSPLAILGKMLHGLKHISLVKCDRISDMGISLFMQTSVSLEVLHLERCNLITGMGLIPIFSSNVKKIREVQVKNCDGIQDVGVFSPKHFSSHSTVKSVSLAHCPGVGNMLLALMGCLCPQITDLDLSGLTGITDEGLLAFLFSGSRQLASLNLSGCTKLTDRVVFAVAEQCGDSLKNFVLDGCKRVTDKGLKAVAKHCAFLEDLDVSQCSVTDEGVIALLFETGLTLSSLNLSGCSAITDKVLPFIEESCHGLTDLNLKHCQGLSRKVIDDFESRLWKCAVLSF